MISQNRRLTMKDNQAKYPQLRFKGFTDSWEQRKLGNYTTLITKGTTPREKSNDGNINFVKVENLSEGIINPTQKITETENNGYLKRSRLQQDCWNPWKNCYRYEIDTSSQYEPSACNSAWI